MLWGCSFHCVVILWYSCLQRGSQLMFFWQTCCKSNHIRVRLCALNMKMLVILLNRDTDAAGGQLNSELNITAELLKAELTVWGFPAGSQLLACQLRLRDHGNVCYCIEAQRSRFGLVSVQRSCLGLIGSWYVWLAWRWRRTCCC